MFKPEQDKIKGAVALGYEVEIDSAPKVLAKGKGELAEKIIALGKENGILIKEDTALFEILYQLDLGEEIPKRVYHVVAQILAFVYRIENKIKMGIK